MYLPLLLFEKLQCFEKQLKEARKSHVPFNTLRVWKGLGATAKICLDAIERQYVVADKLAWNENQYDIYFFNVNCTYRYDSQLGHVPLGFLYVFNQAPTIQTQTFRIILGCRIVGGRVKTSWYIQQGSILASLRKVDESNFSLRRTYLYHIQKQRELFPQQANYAFLSNISLKQSPTIWIHDCRWFVWLPITMNLSPGKEGKCWTHILKTSKHDCNQVRLEIQLWEKKTRSRCAA